MSRPRPAVGLRFLPGALLLLALGSWPFLGGLRLQPMVLDSALWIARGSPANPGWLRWALGTRHFHVGYRPVTALSYTLDHLVAGLDPLVYRLTDLGLHLGAGLFLALLYRVLRPRRHAAAAWLALALFLAHPACEQVVPYLARRGYALATLLSLAGLWLLCRSLQGERRPGLALRSAVGLCFAAALLSNEAAILAIAMAPWLGRTLPQAREGAWRRVLSALVIPGAFVAGALVLRTAIVGGLGGYELEVPLAQRWWPVLSSTWLASFASAGRGPLLSSALLLVFVLTALLALRDLRGAGAPSPAPVFLGWLLACVALFTSQGVWFARQAYFLAVPLALLLADLASSALAGDAQGRWGRVVRLAPPLALAAWIGASSPLLRGPDPERVAAWEQRNERLLALQSSLAACEEPSVVWLAAGFSPADRREHELFAAAPALPRAARLSESLGALWLTGRSVELREVVFFEVGQGPTVAIEAGRARLTFPDGSRYFLDRSDSTGRLALDTQRTLALAATDEQDGARVYLYLDDAPAGRMLSVR